MVWSLNSAWDVPAGVSGARASGPAVHWLVPSGRLHRLREARGITAGQAAAAIRGSRSKISRMEHGWVGFKERDVGDLLTLYGVTGGEERAALLALAREANALPVTPADRAPGTGRRRPDSRAGSGRAGRAGPDTGPLP